MSIDVNELAKIAQADTVARVERLRHDGTLGLGAELNAAFLTGWRYAMKQTQSNPGGAK